MFIERIVHTLLRLCSPAYEERYAAQLAQFLKFCVVGVSNTLISYVLNVLVLLALRGKNLSWDYIAGNGASFFLSVLWSFYWNNKYVFRANENGKRIWWRALLKTYLSYALTGILLSNVLSWLWITKLGVSKYIAPLFNLSISVPLNFLLNKFWAFRETKTDK